MKKTPVKTRRKFDETFKREAVQNWLHSGKPAEVIAEELGLRACFKNAKTFPLSLLYMDLSEYR